MKNKQLKYFFLLQFLILRFCPCFSQELVKAQTTDNLILSGLYSSTQSEPYLIIEKKADSTVIPFSYRGKNYSEIVEKRTMSTKTYKGDQGEILIKYCSRNLHYLDHQKKLRTINKNLFPASDGWSAPSQEFPTCLFKDGSVALTAGGDNKILFNRTSEINGESINMSDFTVGENGMYIKNAFAGIDKKIVFMENAIKTDYILSQPLNISGDLLISEEIVIPEGYYIKTKKSHGGIDNSVVWQPVVYGPDNIEKAIFHSPVFYDNKKNLLPGKYKLLNMPGKIILQITVPAAWLNDPKRIYPVTIDPLVTGPVSYYPTTYLNSCEYPNFEKDSMLVTIPGGITITYFNVEDSYYADLNVSAQMDEGYMMLATSCGSVVGSCDSTKPGTCYWVPGIDFKSQLACCFMPSCNDQTFYLTHGFSRTPAIYGTGCNQNSIYYSPNGQWPFSAYIEGRTVEIGASAWSVFPNTLCADSCTVYLNASARYGVPPYTMTHPWSSDTAVFGNSVSGCNSSGTNTIALRIPGCPAYCDTNSTLSIPPPLIIDVCGDTINGLLPFNITVNPVPAATSATVQVCPGEAINIGLYSCIDSSNFSWTGNNGSSGNGNISDASPASGPDTIIYSFSANAGGCNSPANTVSAIVLREFSINDSASICEGNSIYLQNGFRSTPGIYYDTLSTAYGCDSIIVTDLSVHPVPLANAGADTSINTGDTALISASGGTFYLWSTGDTSAAITVSPAMTKFYTVTVSDSTGCSSVDKVTVFVEYVAPQYFISVPTIFSPNGDAANEMIFVHGKGIKEFSFIIFDRLGEKIFETKDKSIGWDGKRNGEPLNSAVFAYLLSASFIDGSEFKEKGNITLIR